MDEHQVKHLEFIQSVITRCGTNSFIIKGWAITVSGALYGYTVNNLSWNLALVAMLPASAFWFLDSYFLYLERQFRRLYDDVRRSSSEIEPFSMNIGKYESLNAWWKAARSLTLVVFYGAIIFAGLVILVAGLWTDC